MSKKYMRKPSETIIQALLDAEDFECRGTLGTGPFARPINERVYDHWKIIIPGDDKQRIMYMVYLLLHDLSIDLHLSDSVRTELEKQFMGGA